MAAVRVFWGCANSAARRAACQGPPLAYRAPDPAPQTAQRPHTWPSERQAERGLSCSGGGCAGEVSDVVSFVPPGDRNKAAAGGRMDPCRRCGSPPEPKAVLAG
jgi:hypothetical protein